MDSRVQTELKNYVEATKLLLEAFSSYEEKIIDIATKLDDLHCKGHETMGYMAQIMHARNQFVLAREVSDEVISGIEASLND